MLRHKMEIFKYLVLFSRDLCWLPVINRSVLVLLFCCAVASGKAT